MRARNSARARVAYEKFVLLLPAAIVLDDVVVRTRLEDVDFDRQVVKRFALLQRNDLERHNVVRSEKRSLRERTRAANATATSSCDETSATDAATQRRNRKFSLCKRHRTSPRRALRAGRTDRSDRLCRSDRRDSAPNFGDRPSAAADQDSLAPSLCCCVVGRARVGKRAPQHQPHGACFKHIQNREESFFRDTIRDELNVIVPNFSLTLCLTINEMSLLASKRKVEESNATSDANGAAGDETKRADPVDDSVVKKPRYVHCRAFLASAVFFSNSSNG